MYLLFIFEIIYFYLSFYHKQLLGFYKLLSIVFNNKTFIQRILLHTGALRAFSSSFSDFLLENARHEFLKATRSCWKIALKKALLNVVQIVKKRSKIQRANFKCKHFFLNFTYRYHILFIFM